MNLVLIGYRGTGKTTVARHLGLSLGWPWLDADVELEFRAGKSISAIFADDGEEAFRDLESEVLVDLSRMDQHVLALGGGAVLRDQNRQMISKLGKVVWLKASPTTILKRLARDATTAGRRPNLTAGGGRAEVEQLLAMRAPIYRECAHLEVDTEGRTPAEIAAEMIDRLNLRPEPASGPLDNA
ncbi:MAG TPA: shikimate kinase [Burkholderiaceae bacterium]|nr:shikimate kinase [Burkholderiaceae bacterium]